MRLAIKLSIKYLRAAKQRIVFDANMHNVYGADYPHAINSAKEVRKIDAAIDSLNGLNTRLSILNEAQKHAKHAEKSTKNQENGGDQKSDGGETTDQPDGQMCLPIL